MLTAFCQVMILVTIALLILAFIKTRGQLPPLKSLTLDDITTVTNVILGALYVPMSALSVFSIFLFDDPPSNASAYEQLLNGVQIGVFTPLAAIIGIYLSVMLRRQGQSKSSFIIQFAGLFFYLFLLVSVFG